ncbi:MAG: filamentous hemagglutinin N-terminal domain-containing protein [Xenococcaceae cyanobacterium]
MQIRIGLIGIALASICHQAAAQITPDQTLPSNSQVIVQDNLILIGGGTRMDRNLFHSFEEFSVSTGSTAYFNNALDIQNIFTRVTGGNISNIDGLMRANGVANLFLLNPNGIIFGPNAQINIGGSFLATTANFIEFADSSRFGTGDSNNTILTVSVPIGLGFGSNSGPIVVQGSGHGFTASDPNFAPLTRGSSISGLAVRPGQSLVLVASNLSLEGANLAANGGNIQLASVKNGMVGLNPTSSGLALNFDAIQEFGNISLSNKAAVDASGMPGGSIQLTGFDISISDGSLVLIQNQGLAPSGNIVVQAAGELYLSGTTADGLVRSMLRTEAFEGMGGDIIVDADSLRVDDGAGIITAAFVSGQGGQLAITANSAEVSGFNQIIPSSPSAVVALTFSSERGGDVTIETNELLVRDGGTVGTLAVLGTGDSGSLQIEAEEITVRGTSAIKLPSSLQSGTTSRGRAGQIVIRASTLNILDGGEVNSSTGSQGDAGDILIEVDNLNVVSPPGVRFVREGESVRVVGGSPSRIGAVAAQLTEAQKAILGDLGEVSGSSGRIVIKADSVFIDRGRISVGNAGSGETGNIELESASLAFYGGRITATGIQSGTTNPGGGNIRIDVNSLWLDKGDIATTSSGLDSGNISIAAEEVRLLNDSGIEASNLTGGEGDGGNLTIEAKVVEILDSSISGSANGRGNGGNIEIVGPQSIELKRSDISARALQGEGGNITINGDPKTHGIFNVDSSVIDATASQSQGGNIKIGMFELLLSRDSQISATAGGSGDGGNIDIATDLLILLDSSSITANAVQGRGGNIRVSTRGFFAPLENITASSEFSTDGIVEIKTQFDLQGELEQLEAELVNRDQLVTSSCLARSNESNSSFVVRGSGGLPPGSEAVLPTFRAPDLHTHSAPENQPWQLGDPVIEANSIQQNPDGRWLLVAVNRIENVDSQVCH